MADEVVLNLSVKAWCEKHEAPYINLNANMTLAGLNLMDRVMPKLIEGINSNEEFGARLREIAESEKSFCCLLNEDEHDELLALARPTTGDEEGDRREADRYKPDSVTGVRNLKGMDS